MGHKLACISHSRRDGAPSFGSRRDIPGRAPFSRAKGCLGGETNAMSSWAIRHTNPERLLTPERTTSGVIDLLKVAKHGPGENVYLVRFSLHPSPCRKARAALER